MQNIIKKNSEDFILLECLEWPEEQRDFFIQQNKGFRFFETDGAGMNEKSYVEFPDGIGL